MQQLLQSFGVQPILLAAQIVNFLIIFWLLKKFAYKPIFTILEKRRKLILEGVENAQKSEEVLQKALEEEKKVLKKAQTEAQGILSDAQKQSQEVLQSAQENAKLQVAKMIEEGKKEIEEQTLEAERTLSTHTAQLAVKLLEKSLTGLVDNKTQKAIVEKVVKKVRD